MPTSIWLCLSFVTGLAAGLPFVVWLLQAVIATVNVLLAFASLLFNSKDWRRPGPYIDNPWAWNLKIDLARQSAVRTLAVVVIVGLFGIALGEAFSLTFAFNLEEALASDLYVHVAGVFTLGLLVRLYSNELGGARRRVVRALKGADPVPWQTQLAGLFVLCLVAVAFMRPDVVERMSFLKAGEVEVHVAEGSSSTIKDAPVNFDDFSHKEILRDWSEFDMLSLPEDGTNVTDTSTPTEDRNKKRENVYKYLGYDTRRLEASDILFKTQFNPIYKFSACFQAAGLADILRNNHNLEIFIEEYANLIKAGVSGVTLQSQFDEVDRLGKTEQDAIDELQESWIDYATTVETSNLSECPAIALKIDSSAPFKTAISAQETRGIIWDPYIVATVADLIAFLDDQKARADFLNDVSGPLLKPAEACEPHADCTGLTPGVINLLYANVDAQVKSHATWPLEPQAEYLDKALDGLEQIISRNGPSSNKCSKGLYPKCPIRSYFLKSKFIELSLGLELYYRHALSGENLNERDRARWGLWIDDMRRILNVLLGIHPGKLAPFDNEYAGAWQEAAPSIQDSDDGGLIADGESGAALGIVLLAKQTKTPSAEDCLAAKALSEHLLYHQYPAMMDRKVAFGKKLGSSTAATYKGLIEQFDNRIRAECPDR